jgi:hypothetical protein
VWAPISSGPKRRWSSTSKRMNADIYSVSAARMLYITCLFFSAMMDGDGTRTGRPCKSPRRALTARPLRIQLLSASMKHSWKANRPADMTSKA